MKIILLIINVCVFLGSGFFFVLSLSGGSGTDPVFIGTLIMVITSLLGIIGMGSTFKRVTRTSYYIFAAVGILIPAVMFQYLILQ
ncbi:MAG: hypothetical protein V4524_01345 [Patescibacteria group bacterium]